MATNSIDFKVKNGLKVSNTATILGSTQADSTQTGALIVEGGAGIGKNLHVGGTITGNLTGTATLADDLTGGATGSIPYQSTANNTTFLAIGTNNYVLASNGTEPTWASLNSLGAGSATTATNIAGGTAGQVPYQTGPGATSFFGPGTAGQLLISDGASSPVYTNTSTFKVGSADAADNWTTARTITLAGDLSGNVDIDGTTNVTLTATINANSVALGTDTTGIYVASAATSGLGLSGSANTEGSTFTVNSNATSSNSTSTIVFRDETGGFYANTLNLQGTTPATSTQTGTLLVSGGAGIGGNVYIGGNLQFETAANQTAGLYNDETTGRLIFGMLDNSNIYGAYFSVFGNQWNDTTQRGGAEFVVDTRNSTTKGFTIGRFDGASWSSDFKMDVSGNFTLTGITYLTNTANSDSTLTGALVLSGGAAIAKNLTVGGSLNLLDATNSINTSSGSLTLAGGLGVGKNLNVGGLSTLTNTTEASSTITGALVVSGGVGVGKNLYVGGNTVISGDLEVKGGDITTDQSTFNLLNANASTVNFAGAATELNLGATSGYTTIKNSTTITSVASSINTNSGALVVHGGVGIGQKLFVQSSGTFGGDLLPSANNSYNLGSADYRWKTLYVAAATIDIGGSTIQADNGILLTEKLSTTSTQYSTSTTTGALTVVGGVGIGKNVIIGDTAASTSSITTNALYVEGGAGVNGSLYVKGQAVFEQDAIFLGDTTYVFNTNTIYSDNIIELHYHEGTSSWTVDDGQDIGIRMHFYDTTNTNAFFGRAGDTGYLEWYGRGVEESTTGTIIGEYGTFKTGSIQLVHTTSSNSTQTGALVVEGGVGIGENLNVGGNTTITGDLAVNGGDITSSAASFNLINANVNTLNFVGAGTAITIGSTSGYTNVRNQFTATDTTNATSTSTGALVVHGGVAIKQDTHIGGTITLPNENHASLTASVSSTSPTTVDTWSTSTYRTAKYIAQITQGSNYQAAELLIIHDGADSYISEFAIVRSNTNLGTFTTDVNSNNVRLRITMNSATAATIKLSRLLITV